MLSQRLIGVKFLVLFVFLTMAACTVLNAVDVQYWFGAGFGDIARFADSRQSRFYTPLMGSFIAMLVQLFFCCRIVSLRRAAWPLVLLAALISMTQCAGGMGAGILSYIVADEVNDATHTAFVYMWLIGQAIADVLIAAVMIVFFFKAKSNPATPQTAVRLIIETNLLSAVTAIVGMVLFVGVPNTTYFVCPTLIIPALTPDSESEYGSDAEDRV
ncbi:hypothetical protein B0H17DRAFT_320316 [Mycena rosella]|uniref:Uncharacterized protein n=1 Tax=Mycena rosella TaxID=1033263 RepID=A0AAD7G2S5_MYCRO|nr:hypothetical protein B0H17DRAFT_320316 [Mycena rosella]